MKNFVNFVRRSDHQMCQPAQLSVFLTVAALQSKHLQINRIEMRLASVYAGSQYSEDLVSLY